MASSGDKLIYFLAGGFVGAAVALLFAPKSGEQTRKFLEDKYREGTERLSQKASDGRERVAEKSRDLADRVTGTINKSKEGLQRQKEQLDAAVEAGKEAYREERRKLETVPRRKTKAKRKSAS